jgi:hypothetical protein
MRAPKPTLAVCLAAAALAAACRDAPRPKPKPASTSANASITAAPEPPPARRPAPVHEGGMLARAVGEEALYLAEANLTRIEIPRRTRSGAIFSRG